MLVIHSAAGFATALDDARLRGLSVGVVPTMGALHAGHLSLVERACAESDFVAVTIFVNPMQFNDEADLSAYPRDLDSDIEMLSSIGQGVVDVVFAPEVPDLYPDHPRPPSTTVHVDGLTDALEGKFRPGHFDGVATVVAKLFALSGRCRAFFGEKDFQQVAVVRKLARDLCLPVEVVACSTVRESDGLAMSSRNARLSPEARSHATVLHRALTAGRRAVSEGEDRPGEVREIMQQIVLDEPGVELDYAEVVDHFELSTPDRICGEVRLLIAARLREVRLIDNVAASAPATTGTTSHSTTSHSTTRKSKT
jgi:pantoate--beta-alanine ligase